MPPRVRLACLALSLATGTTAARGAVDLPNHAHGHGRTDLNFLVPERVERVSWREGPYAAQDGDSSAASAAGVDDRHLHPAEPRAIRLSLHVGF